MINWSSSAAGALRVFIIVGEESGDQLGAALMRALRNRLGDAVTFAGVGGRAMAAEGLASLFPLSDIAVVGFLSVAQRFPTLLARLRVTAAEAVRAEPNVLVIVDSPDFTHRVARKVRAAAPHIPIIDYVCPSVWAWRPWRARRMRSYVDHVLALLPFEPDALRRLGGPPSTFVGHPLAATAHVLRPGPQEARRRLDDPPVLLVLPGSRSSEVQRHLPPFAATVERVREKVGALEVVLPTVPYLADWVIEATAAWPARPRIVISPEDKHAAFRVARAALAASGTVTLELALAGIPTVAAYRMARIEGAIVRRLVSVPSVILTNLVLGENAVPELLLENCTPERLSAALEPLLFATIERQRQLEAFARLDALMGIGGPPAEDRAAEIVLATARRSPAFGHQPE